MHEKLILTDDTSLSGSFECCDDIRTTLGNLRDKYTSCIIISKTPEEYKDLLISNNIIDSNNRSVESIHKEISWITSNFGREPEMTNNTWFISDTHFNHKNIIDYCNRPFESVEDMNESMIKNWNSVVGVDDIVWHLGDFAFGNKDEIPNLVSRLNGRINLVLGNHDKKPVKFYYDAGFHRVYDHPVLINNFFVLSHAPMEWVKNPMFNIYGHVHDTELYKTWCNTGLCACVERHEYTPISWKTIKDKLGEYNG